MFENIRLETDRLILRMPCKEDLPHWHRFFLSERAVHIGGGPKVSKFVSWNAYAGVVGHWGLYGWGLFIAELKSDGTPVGDIGAWHPDGWPEQEFGWDVWDPALEGKGYATEAILACRAHAEEHLGWESAVSYIDPDNLRSIRVAERVGCVLDRDAKGPSEGDLVYRHPMG